MMKPRPRHRLTRRALVAGAGAAVLAARGAMASEAQIEALLARLSLDEQIAQLFMLEALGTAMTAQYSGALAVWQPGGVILNGENIAGIDGVKPFVDAIHASDPTMPPLVATDEEGGPVTRLAGDPAPDPVTLGDSSDAVVRAAGRARNAYVRSFDLDINLAPVVDVAYQPDSIMTGRSFGSDPAVVAEKAAAFIRGARGTGAATTAKHFPGHGRTTTDSHIAIPTVDVRLAEWRASDGLPFKAAVNAGVDLVMVGHLQYVRWDSAPASLSPVAIGILRNELGFDGPVITDDLGMGALSGMDPFDVVDRALAAGVDLLLYALYPAAPADLMAHVKDRVTQGQIPASRIAASVRRLLRLRAKLGRL